MGVRWFAMAILMWAIGACSFVPESAIRLTYDRADWLLKRKVNQYVDLDTQQQEQLRVAGDRLHAWHRTSELPKYAELLERAAERFEAPMGEREVQTLVNLVHERWATGARVVVAELGPLLTTVTAEQRTQASARFARDNDRFVKAHIAPGLDSTVSARTDRLSDQIEHWTGKLTSRQRDIVRALIRSTPDFPAVRLVERRRVQLRLERSLTGDRDPKILNAALLDLLVAPILSSEPAYRVAVSRYEAELVRMLTKLNLSLTPKQRENAVERLRRVALKIRELALPAGA